MNINIVILVVAVWGGRLLRDFIEELLMNVFPASEKKATKIIFYLLSRAIGWGAFLLYIYFAGYQIMDKNANQTVSWIIALAPNVLIYGYKLFFTKAAVIE